MNACHTTAPQCHGNGPPRFAKRPKPSRRLFTADENVAAAKRLIASLRTMRDYLPRPG